MSFYYAGINSSYTEHFEVGYSTTTKAPKDFIWSDEVTVNDNTWRLYEESFPVGTKYVAIKCTSDDQMYLLMDDFNFVPVLCDPQDVCHVNFELTDSYGDTWNDAAIKVVDVATNTVLGLMTNDYNLYDEIGYDMECTQTKSLAVCDGQELRFEWVSGYYDNECSYVVTDNNGEVIFSGTDAMGSSVNYTVSCSPSYIFLTSGDWNDGDNWNIGEVPEEGSDVIIQADAVIPAGYTAYAWDVTLNGGSITVEDGGQLWHRTDNLLVTMKKNIVGYGDANSQNHYYLLAHPFNDNIPVPSEMTAAGCDLYKFNGLEPGAEWRNNRQEPINELRQLSGYLFASPIDLELSFTGSTTKSGSYYLPEVEYYEDPNSNFNGWTLWGNFLTCNIYVYTKDDEGEYVPMEVMVYNEAGEKVMLSAGPIPPMSAYFLKLTQTMTVYFLYYRVKPEGVINSLFTVNSNGDQVRFSQGNLQYIGSASTPYWKFADKQWETLGNNGQGSTSQNVDRDLFGWGTSGYDHGAVCYQPWSTSQTNSDYLVYNNRFSDLNSSTGKADWGYNAIRNGGNQENSGWRTLTNSEWTYIIDGRNTASGIRFALGSVNGVDGLILLPDNWDASTYTLNYTNDDYGNFSGFYANTISATDWTTILEANGAVFLPKTVGRDGTSITTNCNYWSSTHSDINSAYCVYFGNNYVGFSNSTNDRSTGNVVRLVNPVHN